MTRNGVATFAANSRARINGRLRWIRCGTRQGYSAAAAASPRRGPAPLAIVESRATVSTMESRSRRREMGSDNDLEAQAGAALLAVRKQRGGAAARLVTPWWYHPALGVLVGVMMAAQAARSSVVGALGTTVCLL